MKILKQSPLKQIRMQCIECCGDSNKTVRFCHSLNCPLWYFRFGRFPKTIIRERGKKYEPLFNKKNFIEGGKFSPRAEMSSYKL